LEYTNTLFRAGFEAGAVLGAAQAQSANLMNAANFNTYAAASDIAAGMNAGSQAYSYGPSSGDNFLPPPPPIYGSNPAPPINPYGAGYGGGYGGYGAPWKKHH
jgi:hypothetical protein